MKKIDVIELFSNSHGLYIAKTCYSNKDLVVISGFFNNKNVELVFVFNALGLYELIIKYKGKSISVLNLKKYEIFDFINKHTTDEIKLKVA